MALEMKNSVQVSLSRELADLLDGTGAGLDARVREALVLTLFQEGTISSGKAATLLDISKEAFRRLLSQRDLPYFDQSLEDVLRDADTASSVSRD
jgi:predicted HTH domain antitoxin